MEQLFLPSDLAWLSRAGPRPAGPSAQTGGPGFRALTGGARRGHAALRNAASSPKPRLARRRGRHSLPTVAEGVDALDERCPFRPAAPGPREAALPGPSPRAWPGSHAEFRATQSFGPRQRRASREPGGKSENRTRHCSDCSAAAFAGSRGNPAGALRILGTLDSQRRQTPPRRLRELSHPEKSEAGSRRGASVALLHRGRENRVLLPCCVSEQAKWVFLPELLITDIAVSLRSPSPGRSAGEPRPAEDKLPSERKRLKVEEPQSRERPELPGAAAPGGPTQAVALCAEGQDSRLGETPGGPGGGAHSLAGARAGQPDEPVAAASSVALRRAGPRDKEPALVLRTELSGSSGLAARETPRASGRPRETVQCSRVRERLANDRASNAGICASNTGLRCGSRRCPGSGRPELGGLPRHARSELLRGQNPPHFPVPTTSIALFPKACLAGLANIKAPAARPPEPRFAAAKPAADTHLAFEVFHLRLPQDLFISGQRGGHSKLLPRDQAHELSGSEQAGPGEGGTQRAASPCGRDFTGSGEFLLDAAAPMLSNGEYDRIVGARSSRRRPGLAPCVGIVRALPLPHPPPLRPGGAFWTQDGSYGPPPPSALGAKRPDGLGSQVLRAESFPRNSLPSLGPVLVALAVFRGELWPLEQHRGVPTERPLLHPKEQLRRSLRPEAAGSSGLRDAWAVSGVPKMLLLETLPPRAGSQGCTGDAGLLAPRLTLNVASARSLWRPPVHGEPACATSEAPLRRGDGDQEDDGGASPGGRGLTAADAARAGLRRDTSPPAGDRGPQDTPGARRAPPPCAPGWTSAPASPQPRGRDLGGESLESRLPEPHLPPPGGQGSLGPKACVSPEAQEPPSESTRSPSCGPGAPCTAMQAPGAPEPPHHGGAEAGALTQGSPLGEASAPGAPPAPSPGRPPPGPGVSGSGPPGPAGNVPPEPPAPGPGPAASRQEGGGRQAFSTPGGTRVCGRVAVPCLPSGCDCGGPRGPGPAEPSDPGQPSGSPEVLSRTVKKRSLEGMRRQTRVEVSDTSSDDEDRLVIEI
ncbi:PREDICTED: zinc finger protein 831 [Condylura cristata]|uniref:zinc finger protein 831 n=1 Tax=Condylura cristata TaxID=143302 RepID=UPI0006436506|nr:PREDICTED: zinc finger protein 831 [Condylura cristata]